MRDPSIRLAFVAVLLVALLLVVVASLRNSTPGVVVPTANVAPVATAAVATFAAGLTGTADALPTASFTATSPRPTATDTQGGTAETPNCLGLHFVRDVTIPDNTPVIPAQVFTKTWLVTNSGTCPWAPGFQVVLIGGLAMGGSAFQITQNVGPGTTLQISIKMAAPTNQTGIVQGTWMMADAAGKKFGDYLSVVVVVRGNAKTPPATAPTTTPSRIP